MDQRRRAVVAAILAAVLSAAWPVAVAADPGTLDPTIKVISDGSGTTVTASGSAGQTSVAQSASVPVPGSSSTSVDANVTTTSNTVTTSVDAASSGSISVTPTNVTGTVTAPSATISNTSTAISGPTSTITTTGTTATAGAPTSTVTVGTLGGSITTPDLSGIGTGSGPETASQGATPSGSGLSQDQSLTSSVTDSGAPARVAAGDSTMLDQGISAGAIVNEPVSKTALRGSGGANVVLCILANASADPTKATLSSLCSGGPSTANGAAQLGASNGITGTTVTSDAAARAAACLLATASSPAPSNIDSSDLARASLSSLCGADPSAGGVTDNARLGEDRTGTSVIAGPAADLAACLLGNAALGTTTVAQLASTCGTAPGGAPSTGAVTGPVSGSDNTTGTAANIAPAANAALCVIANALANVPSDATQTTAHASLNTACTSTSGAPGPSTANVASPISESGPTGTGAEIAPAANAALCILANAGVNTSTASASLMGTCPVTAGVITPPQGGTTTPTTAGGNVEAREGANVPAPMAIGGTGPAAVGAGAGQGNVSGALPAGAGAVNVAGLPSTSTAVLGGIGLMLMAFGAAAFGRKRRR